MKEFKSAIEDVLAEDEREAKIVALVNDEGMERADAERQVDEEDAPFVTFTLDDRTMKSYRPNEAQLAFMLATLGRGQSKAGRFSSVMNIMFESLEADDRDWLEGRMLTRDPKNRVPMKVVEGIFEYLMEEWFRETVPGHVEAVSDAG